MQALPTSHQQIVTVCLNPSIDRIIEVDNFTIGEHQVGRELMRTPGGKAVNVSRVLANLNVPSTATGFMGAQNRFNFEHLLTGPMITDEFVTLAGRTRENVTIVDPSRGQETHVRDVGLAVNEQALSALADKLTRLSTIGSIVIFAGSLPPGLTPDDLARLVRISAAAGARVAVDTSGPALAAMRDMPLWLIKPNRTELAQLLGLELHNTADTADTAQILAAGRQARKCDKQNVLLSSGGEGAFLFTDRQVLHAQVDLPAGLLLNTVGCGDALLGAFIAGLWRHLPIEQALSDACACAAASACTSVVAAFDPAIMQQLQSQVKLSKI
ncbi:MAG: 1-phosphofructokinase family hexose kinase [Planctomycetes bacterium]|nr:1-phosphofructokinase family hexose kinase [Planctomycetota bacterium]